MMGADVSKMCFVTFCANPLWNVADRYHHSLSTWPENRQTYPDFCMFFFFFFF